MAKHGPSHATAAGGRIHFNSAGRAIDPASGHFLSGRQVGARYGAMHREGRERAEAREAAREAARAPEREPGRAGRSPRDLGELPPPTRQQRDALARVEQLRIPKGLPGAGTFLPAGVRGSLRLARLELLLGGRETEFVRLKIGGTEFRGRNVEASLLRGVAGAVIADAIRSGAAVAAGYTMDDISDLVTAMEDTDYADLEGWDGSSLEIEPEDDDAGKA